jgi:hypothetical protein
VCAIGTDRVADKGLERKMGEVLSAQGKEMSEIKSNIAALSTQMAAIMEEVKRNRIDRYRAQSRSPSPRKGDKGLAQVSRVAPLEFKASLFS